MDTLLTAEEVGRILGVRRRWVYDSLNRGDMPSVRVGRYVRVRETDLHRFLAVNARTLPTEPKE